jgi:uncharacterized membrane protein
MSDNKMPDHEMIVIAFENEYEAQQVLDSLKAMESMDVVDLKNGAVIVRSESGEVKINETSDFDTKQGAIGGAVAGAVLGLLGGGLVRGALLGAAGGAAALVDFEQVDQAMEELDKFAGGNIMRHTLSDEVYAKLSEAVED